MSSGNFTRGDLYNVRRCSRGYITNFLGGWLGLLLFKGSPFSSSIWTLDKVSVKLSIVVFFGEAFMPFIGDSDAIFMGYLRRTGRERSGPTPVSEEEATRVQCKSQNWIEMD